MKRKEQSQLNRGIYEKLITRHLETELARLDKTLKAKRENIQPADAADRLALHLFRVMQSAIESVDETSRVRDGLSLLQSLIELIASNSGENALLDEVPVKQESVLRAILSLLPDNSYEVIEQPLIPLLDTTLLTNAPGEPRVGSQLLTEIDSATQIDLVMAFIRFSGIRDFLPRLKRHCEAGRKLRVLTTTYTNSTELLALQKLEEAGAEIRVSYDTSSTRLHAKAWLFRRPGSMSTAYIGSSNLTYSAQRSGLEWNVRVSGARNSSVIQKVAAVFESYWEGGDFEIFEADEFLTRTAKQSERPVVPISLLEIRLFPFQERLLEQIEVARESGRHKNLLVSATGTGKTVMAAVDYARLRRNLPRSRLLFVAHTKEILEQSLQTFRHAVRDAEFGELWVAGERPRFFEHVFASIQSLNSAGYEQLAADHFDVVIVDEIHHGAAESYTRLLDHIRPRELIGLTATPERADGLPILNWFGEQIAAELRLWDAIDQNRLVPFDYYGVHDGSDLTGINWKRGSGYDVSGLTNLYTANDYWAKQVISQLRKRVGDPNNIRALGFCVSIEHAQFMARVFNESGIKAAAIWGDNKFRSERRAILRKLEEGRIAVLFSVDLFNEGVDVPHVDTLLLLRPTDSPVLFIQQLGRGLRKAEGKTACLVLDFVGLHRKEFRFHRRLQALFGGSRKRITEQVKAGFPFLPAGCHMELEAHAREIVLKNIRNSVPTNWRDKTRELRQLASEGHSTLEAFLEHSGLELEDIYQGNNSWSDLREASGLAVASRGPFEKELRRACSRILHVDDLLRLDSHIELLGRQGAPTFSQTDSKDACLARMLVASVGSKVFKKEDSLNDSLRVFWEHRQIRSELIELFNLLKSRIDHHHSPVKGRTNLPLRIHARYSRIEILAAFDPKPAATVPPWQTGVRYLPKARADLLAFTLDKTRGQFSPTTRYRDYAISPNLIHWESQSVVRQASNTGRRYQNHKELGSSIYLFARESTADRAFWFLGPAEFVRSEGERPMAITWRLEVPLPGDLFASFAAAVA